MLNQINKQSDILDENGNCINPGYCFRYLFNYNRVRIRARESRIKEWEFYQFYEDDWVLQFTIGYASIFDSFSFNFFNIKTGERYEFGKLKLHKKNEITYPNPEQDFEIKYESKSFNICFLNQKGQRSISFSCVSKKHGKTIANIKINGDLQNEKMCILTPFKENKHHFYLNYKENYYDCTGQVSIGNKTYQFNKLKGLVDSGRGYWPFRQEWVWSSLTTNIEGHDIGWNLGCGFGNLSYATENMFFFDHKGYQLGHLRFDIDFENQATKPVSIKDEKGDVNITLKPVFDNFTKTDFVWIHNKCHQVYYLASGTIKVNQKEVKIDNVLCFLEHAKNQW